MLCNVTLEMPPALYMSTMNTVLEGWPPQGEQAPGGSDDLQCDAGAVAVPLYEHKYHRENSSERMRSPQSAGRCHEQVGLGQQAESAPRGVSSEPAAADGTR